MPEHKSINERIEKVELRLEKYSDIIDRIKEDINGIERKQTETIKDNEMLTGLLQKLESTVSTLDNTVSKFKESTQLSDFRLNNIEQQVSQVSQDIKDIKSAPAKRYESVVGSIIAVIVTSIVTYFITKLI